MKQKIAYEPHPVSVERKKELQDGGYKIVDVVYAPADVGLPKNVVDRDGNVIELEEVIVYPKAAEQQSVVEKTFDPKRDVVVETGVAEKEYVADRDDVEEVGVVEKAFVADDADETDNVDAPRRGRKKG